MTTTTEVPESTESTTWAKRLMDGVRRVQELHQPLVLWLVGEERSYANQDEAIDEYLSEWSDEDIDRPSREEVADALEHFTVCLECARVEKGAAEEAGYLESQWPCRTAVALGIQEGPML